MNHSRSRWLLFLFWICLFTRSTFADEGRRFLLVISGLGGEAYYSELFRRWSLDLLEIAHRHYGIDDGQTTYLTEPFDNADDGVDGLSRKSAILTAIADLESRSSSGDKVLILLVGHGTAQGRDVRFNLPGPDLSPRELADALTVLKDRRLAVVNTTPSSGPFIQSLSSEGRVVISATAGAHEYQHTLFGGFFIDALANDEADMDKDRQVSLLEAFLFARRQVELAYKSDNRLQSEHPMLDDNGDGIGSRQPVPDGIEGVDGALAGRFKLAGPAGTPLGEKGALLSLQLKARRILDGIERLKREKRLFELDEYEARLEALLVKLALNRRAYRAEQIP